MSDSISYNQFINNADDNFVWQEIKSEEDKKMLNEKLELSKQHLITGTKRQKGDSFEDLMKFIYERFTCVNSISNQYKGDNQIDHIIEFLDQMTPTFIHWNIGPVLVGESKNQNKSIGSRDVADLAELLRSKNSNLGIFTSALPFSKGKTMWKYAEGKRRKIALSNKKYIIGFTIDELSTLLDGKNFYTMIQQKYKALVDDINDDLTNEGCNIPYQDQLHNSLYQLKSLEIITNEIYESGKETIIKEYGELTNEI